MPTITLGENFRVFDFPLYIDWSTRPHQDCGWHDHACVELVLVRRGVARHHFRGETVDLRKGDIFVIPRGESHRYDRTADFSIANVLFDMGALPIPVLDARRLPGYAPLFAFPETYWRETGKVPFFSLLPDEFKAVEASLRKMSTEQSRADGKRKFYLVALFMELIVLVSGAFSRAEPRVDKLGKNMEKALTFMCRNLERPIAERDIARAAGMSVSTLVRSFREAVGETPGKHLTKLRITEAAGLLRNTGLSVAAVAAKAGFADSNYFAKVFSRETGVSPSGFRAELKNAAGPLPAQKRRRQA